ncbi:Satratoxin biosynthesis SC1 cluster protein 4 [Colletotrichum orbiculare MAFF 240422]|uniref:Satratoxin biosynthesis SC1 cluster protein 4 n=1 Tax=Colletotrichum orbiculare (strain 104-T / ATCC 96160 / CBS 514.97 / LARS 414 / MAFF 240422) TaxID=1213857 RepID=N4VQ14_COLOR|nr:Satratoxin biosynthesis SC1 cluster protein 4 [Colletotrichum orbiculare MAFF 240422]
MDIGLVVTAEGEGPRVLTPEYLAEDSGGTLISISVAFAVLTTLFLGLRLYAKQFTAAGYGIDDYFLVAAYLVDLGMCAIGIVMVRVGGVGRHVEFVEEVHPALLAGWAKCILAFEIVYFASVALPKMGIVCLYLRVFNWKGAMRVVALVLLGVLAATSVSFIVTACLQCTPIAFWWDRTIPGGRCVDVQAFFHAQSIPGFVLDFVIMALPMKTIWGLKLPTHKRIALVGIFMVGSFGIVASIIRAVTFFGTAAFTDRTWASVALVGWSIIETGTYIIAACLPHLKPMISHYTPPWLKSAVRRTISQASNSASKASGSKDSRQKRGDDQVELTARSKREMMDAESATMTGDEERGGYEGVVRSPTRSVEVRRSDDVVSGEWARQGHIRVTTEVKLERVRTSAGLK